MRSVLLVAITFIFLFISCRYDYIAPVKIEEPEQTKQPIPEGPISNGMYKGKFQRQVINFISPPVNVTMTFKGNEWNGTSESPYYPALCRGTYQRNGDTLIFRNECPWPAHFDWSLILNGKFILTQNTDTVSFYKKTGKVSFNKDIYMIIKQTEKP